VTKLAAVLPARSAVIGVLTEVPLFHAKCGCTISRVNSPGSVRLRANPSHRADRHRTAGRSHAQKGTGWGSAASSVRQKRRASASCLPVAPGPQQSGQRACTHHYVTGSCMKSSLHTIVGFPPDDAAAVAPEGRGPLAVSTTPILCRRPAPGVAHVHMRLCAPYICDGRSSLARIRLEASLDASSRVVSAQACSADWVAPVARRSRHL
jgi:hypothetical protein